MLEILPFRINFDATMIAGACLWSFALYLSLFSVREWITTQLDRWFNFAERSLYTSAEEFERTRQARESQNAFYASLFSIIPFLGVGILCNLGVEFSLGRSWAISMGLLACMACGVYELGRQSNQSE
ncbi:MAG: hypothetical protein BRC43_12000 [Cyanobacteria bacterium QS_3_48_167]|nr:MAG: hypothetical protein BRC43_12000 [Cyanobacteria bacterium QS_3_48_167]